MGIRELIREIELLLGQLAERLFNTGQFPNWGVVVFVLYCCHRPCEEILPVMISLLEPLIEPATYPLDDMTHDKPKDDYCSHEQSRSAARTQPKPVTGKQYGQYENPGYAWNKIRQYIVEIEYRQCTSNRHSCLSVPARANHLFCWNIYKLTGSAC